jgi:hypothetical protein
MSVAQVWKSTKFTIERSQGNTPGTVRGACRPTIEPRNISHPGRRRFYICGNTARACSNSALSSSWRISRTSIAGFIECPDSG